MGKMIIFWLNEGMTFFFLAIGVVFGCIYMVVLWGLYTSHFL